MVVFLLLDCVNTRGHFGSVEVVARTVYPTPHPERVNNPRPRRGRAGVCQQRLCVARTPAVASTRRPMCMP